MSTVRIQERQGLLRLLNQPRAQRAVQVAHDERLAVREPGDRAQRLVAHEARRRAAQLEVPEGDEAGLEADENL